MIPLGSLHLLLFMRMTLLLIYFNCHSTAHNLYYKFVAGMALLLPSPTSAAISLEECKGTSTAWCTSMKVSRVTYDLD